MQVNETPKIGTILTGAECRDAIHVAIAPVVVAEAAGPGAHVGMTATGEASVLALPLVGIIDPYLKGGVKSGERCYLFLYPNTVTSLRHEWTHPAFERGSEAKCNDRLREESRPSEAASAEAWITQFAENFDMSMTELIQHAEKCLTQEWGFITQYDSDSWRDDWYEGEEEFWKRYAIVTGKPIPNEKPTVFSCSC